MVSGVWCLPSPESRVLSPETRVPRPETPHASRAHHRPPDADQASGIRPVGHPDPDDRDRGEHDDVQPARRGDAAAAAVRSARAARHADRSLRPGANSSRRLLPRSRRLADHEPDAGGRVPARFGVAEHADWNRGDSRAERDRLTGLFPASRRHGRARPYVPARRRFGARPRRRGDHQRHAVARSVRARSGHPAADHLAERASLRRGRRDARRVRRALVRHRRVGAVDDGVADELPRRGAGSRLALAGRARPAQGRDDDGACPGGPESRGRHSRAAVPGQPHPERRAARDRPAGAARRHRAAHGGALHGGAAVPDRRVCQRRESSARARDVPPARARACGWRSARAARTCCGSC